MATIEKSIEVQVPVSVAYDQWTQFEEFPKFMEGVVAVRQLDDKRLRWVAEVGGEQKEWDAEIVRQEPDRVIEWRSTAGLPNSGRVEFLPSSDGTRVTVRMEYEAKGMKESAGAALGVDEGQVEDDLERFRALVESRGMPTGAWPGRIEGGGIVDDDRAL